MRTAHRTIASFATLVLVSIGAVAATGGSTDIYAPDAFAASFGGRAGSVGSRPPGDRYNGPTDTWGAYGFRASFGAAGSAAGSAPTCGSGSTDMYGPHAFAASFGSPALLTVGELAQACEAAAPIAR